MDASLVGVDASLDEVEAFLVRVGAQADEVDGFLDQVGTSLAERVARPADGTAHPEYLDSCPDDVAASLADAVAPADEKLVW